MKLRDSAPPRLGEWIGGFLVLAGLATVVLVRGGSPEPARASENAKTTELVEQIESGSEPEDDHTDRR